MMGKDLRGKRKAKRSKKLQKVKRWLADAIYINDKSIYDKYIRGTRCGTRYN